MRFINIYVYTQICMMEPKVSTVPFRDNFTKPATPVCKSDGLFAIERFAGNALSVCIVYNIVTNCALLYCIKEENQNKT